MSEDAPQSRGLASDEMSEEVLQSRLGWQVERGEMSARVTGTMLV